MINKKEKYLKNYLKYDIFKENLIKQQNKLIQLYKEENSKMNSNNSSYIKPSNSKYENLFNNFPESDLNFSLLDKNNIYKIRLKQTKDTLIEQSKIKWPNINICKNLLELKGNVKIIIILIT